MILRRVLVVLAWMSCLAANIAGAMGDSAPAGAADADPTVLIQFYPTPLTTSPVGALEDQQVWLAKVAGLISDAPPLLQQSILASKTSKQFSANLALLQQLQKSTLADGIVAAKSVAKNGKVGTKRIDGKVGPNLGSGPADTVFTALEPCRIMDSRTATVASGVRGSMAGNQLYQLPGFIAAGQNWGSYGGNATSDCGLNSDVGANIWALAIVITVLNPNFDSFLGVGDNNNLAATLSTVALNYTSGQGLSTQYIVPQAGLNTIYFAMPAQLSANIVFDVVGYFAVSQATPLDCRTLTTSGAMGQLPSGDTFVITALACDAGFTRTGVNCRTTLFNSGLALIDADTDACSWYNGTAAAFDSSNLAIRTTCCRVPGR